MAKKCIVCDQEAQFKIKDTSEYYCRDCAIEHFGDIQLLVTLEEEAQRLKSIIEKLSPQEIDENVQND